MTDHPAHISVGYNIHNLSFDSNH